MGNGPPLVLLEIAEKILAATTHHGEATGVMDIWVHDAASTALRGAEIEERHPATSDSQP